MYWYVCSQNAYNMKKYTKYPNWSETFLSTLYISIMHPNILK